MNHTITPVSVFLLFCFSFVCSIVFAQTDVHMISSLDQGDFLFTQQLPNEKIRVFSRTEEHHFWGEGYAAFFDVQASQDFHQLDINTFPFLINESFYIPFEYGSTIAGYNQFECDFIMESVVARYNAQGDTLWTRITRESYFTT